MIRPARPQDAASVRQLVQDAYGPYVTRLDKPPGPMLDDYAWRIANGQVWVLADGDALTGLLVLKDSVDALLLDNVAVVPGAQGKGHGRALVAFAEAEARRRSYAEVRLYTNVLMAENLALYGRLDFREMGRVNEKGYERVYMAKALP